VSPSPAIASPPKRDSKVDRDMQRCGGDLRWAQKLRWANRVGSCWSALGTECL
jgi:hypothetical protein